MNTVDCFDVPTDIGDHVLLLREAASPERGIVVGRTKCDYLIQRLGCEYTVRKSGSKLVNLTAITNERISNLLSSLHSLKELL